MSAVCIGIADMDSTLVEYVNGIQVIKAFHQSARSFRRFTDVVRHYHDTTLLWWRNTKRIRFTKIQEKKLYQNPTKHIEAFSRALIMYLLIALIDGYLLTLF